MAQFFGQRLIPERSRASIYKLRLRVILSSIEGIVSGRYHNDSLPDWRRGGLHGCTTEWQPDTKHNCLHLYMWCSLDSHPNFTLLFAAPSVRGRDDYE